MNDTAATTPPKHIPVRPDWLALRDEAVIDPERPIIDAHHHLWDHRDRYLLPDLLADTGQGHNIRATVFMQCEAMYRADGDPAMRPVGETEFVNGAAAMSASGLYGPIRACAAIIGYADLQLRGRAREVLEAHIAAGGGRFRGIRCMSAWHDDPAARGSVATPPPDLLPSASFREGFAALAPLGLSFDAWMYHSQLAELYDLARAFPDTPIVLNHVGGANGLGPYRGKRQEVFAEWSAMIGKLATLPNMHIKLGGLGMRLFGFDFHERAMPPSSEELAEAWKPYIETCIAAFGPRRAMFESNFPVDKGTCSYLALWNAFKRVAAGYSESEKHELFSGAAARFYRLPAFA